MKQSGVLSVIAIVCGILLLLYSIAFRASVASFTHEPAAVKQQKQQETEQKEGSESERTQDRMRAVLEAAFGGLFQVDARINPSHVTGDFNGDGVTDVAVAVRLIREVDKRDPSKPSFNLYQPIHTGLSPEVYKTENRLGSLAYYQDRTHLVVMHGTHEREWTTSQPQQRHVLLDFPGIAPTGMTVYRGELRPATAGDEPKPTPPPRLTGDAILLEEVFEEDVGAVIYWDGSRYRTYPVRTSRR
jgi:hypothetical protein